jgi:hypothetical protein
MTRKPETVEYRAWHGMKTRCTNPRRPDWKNYGGRGITVCDRWVNSFETFLADWATWDQQSRNKRPRPIAPRRMTDTSRLEVRLSTDERRELRELASTSGLTSADLARLGIKRLLACPRLLGVPAAGDDGERAGGGAGGSASISAAISRVT